MPEMTLPVEGEERADHFSAIELLELTADSAFYRNIRTKLLARGAKLLSGPRGTGKTHQMRYVYLQCVEKSNLPAAAYVSFSRYARLEPLLRSSPDALKVFNAWMIAKISLGLADFLTELNTEGEEALQISLGLSADDAKGYVAEIENGDRFASHDAMQSKLSMANLHRLFDEVHGRSGRIRTVLLLDDAALSLAPEYHAEFFSVFQDLKAQNVSPKASVYPGTTQYGARFHARHDAEIVNAWLSVEDPEYLAVMGELLSKREVVKDLPKDVVELFQYLSFGVPRTLLTMLRTFDRASKAVSSTASTTVQKSVNAVVQEQVFFQHEEFSSLAFKLPQFKSIIDAGIHVFNSIADAVTAESKKYRATNERQVVIGILQGDRSPMQSRMLNLLVEVGLLYPLQAVQHGEGREYDRYIPHYARLMNERAFAEGRGFSARDTVAFLQRKPARHPVRRTLGGLLGPDFTDLRLSLAPCANCNTARMDEAQRFCHNCGARLPEPSRFQELLSVPIADLPIREWLKTTINRDTELKTLGDLLTLQDPASELRRGLMIGKKRSQEVLDAVSSVVEEFLS